MAKALITQVSNKYFVRLRPILKIFASARSNVLIGAILRCRNGHINCFIEDEKFGSISLVLMDRYDKLIVTKNGCSRIPYDANGRNYLWN
jgi:hypothetical protein